MKRLLLIFSVVLITASLQAQIIRANSFARANTSGGNPELLNGITFDNGDCWFVSGELSISGNVLNYAGTAASNCIQINCGSGSVVRNFLNNNTDYVFECDVVSSAPGIFMSLRSWDTTIRDILKASANYTTGHLTLEFNSGTLTAQGFCIRAYGDAAATVDNVSLKVK